MPSKAVQAAMESESLLNDVLLDETVLERAKELGFLTLDMLGVEPAERMENLVNQTIDVWQIQRYEHEKFGDGFVIEYAKPDREKSRRQQTACFSMLVRQQINQFMPLDQETMLFQPYPLRVVIEEAGPSYRWRV